MRGGESRWISAITQIWELCILHYLLGIYSARENSEGSEKSCSKECVCLTQCLSHKLWSASFPRSIPRNRCCVKGFWKQPPVVPPRSCLPLAFPLCVDGKRLQFLPHQHVKPPPRPCCPRAPWNTLVRFFFFPSFGHSRPVFWNKDLLEPFSSFLFRLCLSAGGV